MKAAVVKGRRLIAYEEVPTPSVQPGTVLLKLIYCCTCGTDLEYVDNKMPGSPVTAGVILGHEFLGEVAAVGEGVEGWSVGERAVPGFQKPCGQCYWCRRGLHRMCMGGPTQHILDKDFAYGSTDGAMAEYFVRLASSLLKVPDSISDEEASLSQSLTVGTWMVHCSGLQMGDSAVVIGAGHIGLATMACARAVGAAPIIVTDMINSRLDVALGMGADVALNPNKVDIVSEIRKLTEAGVDVAFICVRDADVLQQALDVVRMEGRVIIVGAPSPQALDPFLWLYKRVRIEGCQNVGAKMYTTLKLLEYKRMNVKPLISEIMPLKDTQRAFDSLYSGENLVVLLKP